MYKLLDVLYTNSVEPSSWFQRQKERVCFFTVRDIVRMGGSKSKMMIMFIILLIIFKSGWSEGCLDHERFALLRLKHFFDDTTGPMMRELLIVVSGKRLSAATPQAE